MNLKDFKDFKNGYPLNDWEILVYVQNTDKFIVEYVDSDFFMRCENLQYTKWKFMREFDGIDYTCDVCNDSLVVQVGENEYAECPCVTDNEKDIERQSKSIVTEICNLFHLQETKDWEQKAISLIKPLIK